MKLFSRRSVLAAAPVLALSALPPIGQGAQGKPGASALEDKIEEMKKELKKHADERAMVARNLATFDTLDYVVFSNQQWVRFHESHSSDIVVYWPDGHHTNGLPRHIEDLKGLFVYAPDTRIKVHPVKFGYDDLTCVTGIMEGTFTKPMPLGNDKFIQPTGKAFHLPMCTVGHWNNGVMIEEWLFWDGSTYMMQMGIGG
jgi:hypothetical protein